MTVVAFDHVAIPTDRPLEMLTFYRALGFGAPAPQEWQASGATHFALQFGENKINVHAPARWKDPAFTLRGPTKRGRWNASAAGTAAAPGVPACTPVTRTATCSSSSSTARRRRVPDRLPSDPRCLRTQHQPRTHRQPRTQRP